MSNKLIVIKAINVDRGAKFGIALNIGTVTFDQFKKMLTDVLSIDCDSFRSIQKYYRIRKYGESCRYELEIKSDSVTFDQFKQMVSATLGVEVNDIKRIMKSNIVIYGDAAIRLLRNGDELIVDTICIHIKVRCVGRRDFRQIELTREIVTFDQFKELLAKQLSIKLDATKPIRKLPNIRIDTISDVRSLVNGSEIEVGSNRIIITVRCNDEKEIHQVDIDPQHTTYEEFRQLLYRRFSRNVRNIVKSPNIAICTDEDIGRFKDGDFVKVQCKFIDWFIFDI